MPQTSNLRTGFYKRNAHVANYAPLPLAKTSTNLERLEHHEGNSEGKERRNE
jgi:hypothetical protein